MVLITDKFHKVSSGTRAQPTTLTAQKALAASSISTAALNGWATDTPVDFQLYLPDSNNLDNFGNPKPIPGSQSEWTGIVSGTTITQLELTGGSDSIYPIGAIVVALPTANWADSLVEGILVHANANGSLLPSAVTTSLSGTTLPANTVATTSITDGSVTTSKLVANALSLATVSSASSQSGITNTAVILTGLTTSVTIPTGGRKVRICVQVPGAVSTNIATWFFSIYNSATVTGSPIYEYKVTQTLAGSGIVAASFFHEYTPTPGSQSYCAAIRCDTGTGVTDLAATRTSYLTVDIK